MLAWLCAAVAAALFGASATVVFLLARESLAFAPFGSEDWWVFVNLWRPLALVGLVIVPLFSAPLSLVAVWLIRRMGWPRPLADMLAGVCVALLSLIALLSIATQLGPMGDGP
jgi:hypothetical protein